MKQYHFFFKYKLHHLFIWCFVFIAWFYLRYQDYSTLQKALNVTLIKVVDLALLIYLSNYILIPQLLYKKRYLLFAACFISMILISSACKMYVLGHVINNPALYNFSNNLKARIYDNVIPHFFLVVAGASIKFLYDQMVLQKKVTQIAKEKAEAELAFLKSQINPHFLFNSLNSVFFLINKENEQARTALHKFSEILRYQLYECNDEKISIEKEISYLKDYVDLQTLRLNTNCSVDFICSPDVQNFTIEPLLLIPFVENSFKHLSHYSNGRKNEVQIALSRSNGYFNLIVKNTTEECQASTILKEGGIGLSNVTKRLKLLYPNTHRLQIETKDDWFSIDLTLSIN